MDTNNFSFSQAVTGFLLNTQARRLSEHTIADYRNTYKKLAAWLQDNRCISSISKHDIEEFLAGQQVSEKTLLNYHAGLSALWTWALAEGLVEQHVVRQVVPPRPTQTAVLPYTEADVKAMLAVLGRSRSYTRPGKVESDHSTLHPLRNRAIILLLLDTGLRASELCSLQIHQLDVRNRSLTVVGKGRKERVLPFSPNTGQALWKYLATRSGETVDQPLFAIRGGAALTRDRLLKTISIIAVRAGVADPSVHRFRHTFAINYLRNGGDPWSLQMMLGHSSSEMTRRYLAIAQADLQVSHRKASPVMNWKL